MLFVYGMLAPGGRSAAMLRIDAVEIDEPILDKIETKHRVSFDEVEEACLSLRRHIRRGREGLYQVFSQTEDGRYLFIVLADQGGGVWNVVTAREMDQQERRLYQQHRGGR
jgi:uncharacterized DUF497 family protein